MHITRLAITPKASSTVAATAKFLTADARDRTPPPLQRFLQRQKKRTYKITPEQDIDRAIEWCYPENCISVSRGCGEQNGATGASLASSGDNTRIRTLIQLERKQGHAHMCILLKRIPMDVVICMLHHAYCPSKHACIVGAIVVGVRALSPMEHVTWLPLSGPVALWCSNFRS